MHSHFGFPRCPTRRLVLQATLSVLVVMLGCSMEASVGRHDGGQDAAPPNAPGIEDTGVGVRCGAQNCAVGEVCCDQCDLCRPTAGGCVNLLCGSPPVDAGPPMVDCTPSCPDDQHCCISCAGEPLCYETAIACPTDCE